MYSINKLLILRCLVDGKPKSLSRVNTTINSIIGKYRHYSTIRNDVRDLQASNCITIKSASVVTNDRKKYIQITQNGLEYYEKIKSEFLVDMKLRERIKKEVERKK